MTLACEDANLKPVDVVTVADDANRVGNSLLQIRKLRFGHKAKLGPLNLMKAGPTGPLKNKAAYTVTLVACGWAGPVMKLTYKAVGQ